MSHNKSVLYDLLVSTIETEQSPEPLLEFIEENINLTPGFGKADSLTTAYFKSNPFNSRDSRNVRVKRRINTSRIAFPTLAFSTFKGKKSQAEQSSRRDFYYTTTENSNRVS